MMSTYDQEAVQAFTSEDVGKALYPALSQDDDLLTASVEDDRAWQDTDEDEAFEADDPETETATATPGTEADNLVAQYLGDVRRFPLLSLAEERALWARIEACKARLRRALCTTPMALPMLTTLSQRVKRQDLPLRQVVDHADTAPADPQEVQARLAETVRALQALQGEIHDLRAQSRRPDTSASQRRELRRQRAQRWHEWRAAWEALDLHPEVYRTIQRALETARHAQPDDVALRAMHTAVRRAQQGLEQAKAQMMQANLRLVIHVANRYRNRGLPFLDLIQEGNIGLMRALDKFEPARGLKFVTYGHWWIRQAISRAVTEQHRTVRLPSHIIERKSKLRTASDRLWMVHGRAPSIQELSSELDWTPKEVEDLLTAVQPITRLHQSRTEEGNMLMDILADEEAVEPEALIAADQLQRRIAECLDGLTEREALILRRRYGLGAYQAHTLQEIADLLGLSRERVRQLEKQAFEKLRGPQWRALLADFADVA